MYNLTSVEDGTQKKEGAEGFAQQITLDIDNIKLCDYVDQRIKSEIEWYKNEKDLEERQKKNEKYLFGKQIDFTKFKNYQAHFQDNLIWEAESSIKPIALSRLPDLYITSGINDPNTDTAHLLTQAINSEVKQREMRRTLGIAFKMIPVGFMGIIKHRWNPAIGEFGEYEFFPIHYSRIIVDHNAKSNKIQDIDLIRELVEMPLSEILFKFPTKKDELLEALGISENDKDYDNKLATPVDLSEVWFKYYKKTAEGKVQMVSAVLWKYKKVLLQKMLNPNWDWEGQQRSFKFDENKKKKDLSSSELQDMAMSGDTSEMMQETVYRNYLDQPEFPYILLGYDQFATMPYDETSRIEQVLELQDNVNKRGRQITEMADKSKGKHIWSSVSNLQKKDIEELDMDDPDVSVWIDGNVNEGHKFIEGEQPGRALFEDQERNTQRIFQKMGTNSTTRGDKETDVATTSQILRDADYGRIDDIVEDTINFASEKAGQTIMQYMCLRYTDEHLKTVVGKDGQELNLRLKSTMIDPTMKVIVHASGVDKKMRKQEAYKKAEMKMIDPLTFNEDIDAPNPKERTARLMLFMSDPNSYMTKYLMDLPDTNSQVNALSSGTGTLPGGNPSVPSASGQTDQGGQQAILDIQLLQNGQQPTPPQQMSPAYVSSIEAFLKSPDFQSLDSTKQQLIVQYAQSVAQLAGGASATQAQPQPPQATA